MKKNFVLVLPVLLFFVVGGLVLYLQRGSKEVADKHVLPGEDYYIGVELIELPPLRDGGAAWDTVGMAPDVYYTVSWQGQIVFTSSVKTDSLISFWSEAQFDVRKAAFEGGMASLDDVMTAARVRIIEGVPIEIAIYDQDFITDTHIGTLTLQSDSLLAGEQTLHKPLPEVERLVLRVVPIKSMPSLFSGRND